MANNNKETRQQLAVEYDYCSKQIKILNDRKGNAKKQLISKMQERNLQKELHENGMTVTVVESTQKTLNKQAVANRLGITLEEYKQILEDCSENEPKAPYIKVT